MKIKQLSLATIAALYAAGAAASGQLAASHDEPFVKPLAITAEQYAEMQARREALQSQPQTNMGANQHRQRPNQTQKVAFHHEADIQGEHTYIIQLAEAPVASYQGGVSGYAATAANPAHAGTSRLSRFNAHSAASQSYASYLVQRQQAVQNDITQTLGVQHSSGHSYQHAFNGMSLRLSQAEAAQVAQLPGVRAVTRSVVLELQTDVGPQHIGAEPLWNGSAAPAGPHTGQGVIVGILDTGINSSHPSFAASGDDKFTISNPFGEGVYKGDCQKEEFADLCNSKLIGIHSYAEITDSYGDPAFKGESWWGSWDPIRPQNGEDHNGHGSHTASTVAGNVLFNVPYQMPEAGYGDAITGRDTELVFPRVSGVAPHANIISYQVCWAGSGAAPYAGCPQEVSLKAIDDAIKDGVHVINYSVGGAEQFPWESPTELAFLAARQAGISVAASAGNAGFAWMDHVSPWITSVAATSHGRAVSASAKTLSNFQGGESDPSPYGPMMAESLTKGYTGPVVLAADYDISNASCDLPFPAATFSAYPDGTELNEAPIVVCSRSEQSRVAKADNVKTGGAGGFILYNLEDDWDNPGAIRLADYYSLPSAHVNAWDGSQIIEWLANGTGHRVTLSDGSLHTTEREADVLSVFSSRGPSVTNPNVLAPTLAAPGVDIFAAYANDRIFTMEGTGQNWAMISGTSMASPHVAGAMALIKQARPSWSPAQIQSALTTTAGKIETQEVDIDFFAAAGYDHGGSGVINIAKAVRAGLLLDETGDNYLGANPENGGDVTGLNTPYLVNRSCQGTCRWLRTVTATEAGSWDASTTEVDYEGASLLDLSVEPAQFSLAAGESQILYVTASMPDADFQSDINWDHDLGHTVPNNTHGLTLYGQLVLTPNDQTKSTQVLPVIAASERANIPSLVEVNYGRDQGQYLTPKALLPTSNHIDATVYGLTTGEQQFYTLRSSVNVWPMDVEGTVPDADIMGVHFFTVPEGTKRLVVELITEDESWSHASRIDMGIDTNGNGLVDWSSEAICVSETRQRDYCAINNPTPGDYWYILSNPRFVGTWEDPYNTPIDYTVGVSLVSDEISDQVRFDPIESDGFTAQALSLSWDLQDSRFADIHHGVVALSSDVYNLGDLGWLPLRFERGQDDVQLNLSQDSAKVGDIIDFELVQEANLNGQERQIDLQVELSPGLVLIPDSVRGNEFSDGLIQIDGNRVGFAGTQISSADAPRRYEYSTSLDDSQCRLPFSDYPTFVDLPGLGVPALPAFTDSRDQTFTIWDYDGYDRYFPHIPLYGIKAVDTDNMLTIRGNGMLQFDGHVLNSAPGYTLGFDGVRDLVLAPFWRSAGVSLNEFGVDMDTMQPYYNGVYAAELAGGRYVAVQWKNMFNSLPGAMPWDPPVVDRSQTFDFQVLASSQIDFTPGAYEIFFSYAELTGDKAEHTIGIKGYQGVRGLDYPVNGYHFDDFAVNEPEKFADHMIVCANYQGPESTRGVLRFSAKVTADAVSSIQSATLLAHSSDSSDVVIAQTIEVNGNITVEAIADQQMDENTTLEGLTVRYLHSNNRQVGLSVSADNVSAVIDGMNFSLTPDAHWYGETDITVTVYDLGNPSDATSTRFTLTVNSDGETPPAVLPPVEEKPKGDSGSLGYLALMMLALFGVRRRFS